MVGICFIFPQSTPVRPPSLDTICIVPFLFSIRSSPSTTYNTVGRFDEDLRKDFSQIFLNSNTEKTKDANSIMQN